MECTHYCDVDQSAAVLSSAADPLSGKNEPLLSHLQSVYVESTDPAAAQVRQLRHSGHSKPISLFLSSENTIDEAIF